MTPALRRAALCAGIGWVLIFIVVTLCRPLMPVDETRYLSVAWEMAVQHHWILPTLNFEPYSHKPPMLFWLIRAMWEVFGIDVWPARLISFVIMAVLAALTVQLARRLDPARDTEAYALFALCAMPLMLVYGSAVRFDALIAVWIIAYLLTVWRLAQAGAWWHWLVAGVFLGCGILAKGPVACVYMLPAALLAPLWTQQAWRRWYAGVFTALLVGAAIGLAWAIPAALEGGHGYAEKIFVKQSAGRMVQAFDHREPAWFYIPVVLAFAAPLLLWPALWRGVHVFRDNALRAPARFLACWMVPAFLFFSFISSKQIHYMLPLMPGVAVLAGMMLARIALPSYRQVALPLAVMALPSVAVLISLGADMAPNGFRLGMFAGGLAVVHILGTAALVWWTRRHAAASAMALTVAAIMQVLVVHGQTGQAYLTRYDLTPIAHAVQQYADRPMAATPKYDGEYGFMFRIHKPIASIGREDVDAWLEQHPDGIVIARYHEGQIPEHHRVLFRQVFRNNEELGIIARNP